MPQPKSSEWAWVVRTYLFDQFITEQIQQGVDMVVNLAAGLDARPYRLKLPAGLQWIEVDLPDLVSYKQEILRGEKPVCALERFGLDLADGRARRGLFEQLSARAKRALIVTEGIIIYLSADEVRTLACDLKEPASFQHWVLELASPALLRMLQKTIGVGLGKAGVALKFGPPEGPAFFTPLGWKPMDVRSMLKTGAKLKRVPFFLRLMALLPDPKGPPGSRIWSGICLLARGGG
jgi:methyltransferase (TIGR00027 family)